MTEPFAGYVEARDALRKRAADDIAEARQCAGEDDHERAQSLALVAIAQLLLLRETAILSGDSP